VTGSAFVYVSLPPGTAPGATSAAISNASTGTSVTLALVEGGLDPVAVPGNAGDTIALAIQGGSPASFTLVVPPGLRPSVVRTKPPGRRDQPMLQIVRVVFSEPMDQATITGDNIRILLNGNPLSGQVQPAADGLGATLELDEPLAPLTEYVLVIEAGVTDLDGETLEEAVVVPFTTGTSPEAASTVASVTLDLETLTALPLESRQLVLMLNAVLRSADGSMILNQAAEWRSSNADVAIVTGGLVGFLGVQGLAPEAAVYGTGTGTTVITASAGGQAARLTLVIERATLANVSTAGSFNTADEAPNVQNACFLTPAGVAFCSGMYASVRSSWQEAIQSVPGGHTFAAVSAGEGHACGITPAGVAYCWGSDGRAGALGAGALLDNCFPYGSLSGWGCSLTPVPVAGGLIFSQISAGDEYTCGIAADGAAYCWGYNEFGQLGTGNTAPSASPVQVTGGLTFAQISADEAITCALTTAGEAYCWGPGYLGNGTTNPSLSPVAVAGGLRFTQISAAQDHTCGLTAGGSAYCWGWSPHLATHSLVPVKVTLPSGVTLTHLDSGGYTTCGLTSAGAAWCWGSNIGGPSDLYIAPPTLVPGNLSFATLSTGIYASCGITRDNAAYCWNQDKAIVEQPYKVEGQR
jgi:hypothetical protein